MIAANEALFERLSAAGGDLISAELRNQKRAIRTDPTEKAWLKGIDLRSSSNLFLGPTSNFAIGEYGGDLYLIAIGVAVDEPPTEFERTTLNAGAFTAIVSELRVPILRIADLERQLLEYVFYPVDDVERIEMEVIAPFFQSIELYKIDPASALALDGEFGLRAALASMLGAPRVRALTWSQRALERLGYMVRDPAERAPFHLLFRALTETRDDAAFLALYRCVEQLFPVPAVAELSAELGLTGPAFQVAATIERRLGWRQREEDAIAHLFGELEVDLLDRMLGVFGTTLQGEERFRPASKRVYELRNECVHYRPVHAAPGASRFDDWLALADLMLEAVQVLYARYHAAFDEPQQKINAASAPAVLQS